MNSGPSQNYNVIKGLQVFINDIRGCTTKEAEIKRVEKELNKIREKFQAGKALTGYEKKKCVWKLVYIYILGYNVDFGHNYAADLITSMKFSEKSTGYISMSIMFKDSNQELNIMINSIRNDLINNNALCQSMAITLATNLNNQELLSAISTDVLKFMTNYNEKQLYTVKKALICLIKIMRVKKDFHNVNWSKYLIKMVETKNFEVLLALCGLVLNIFKAHGTAGYEELAIKLFNTIPYKSKDCPEEYIYYHIKSPWLQIKSLKIIQCINPNSLDQITINHIKEYVDYIAKKIHSITSSESRQTRIYADYCIFFECVNLIDHLNLKLHHKTFDTYVNILGVMLIDDHRKHPNKDVNTKYLALDGLAKLSKYTHTNKILKDYSNIIIMNLRDNDISIRRRALDLLFLCCNADAVKIVCKEMLLYLKEDEPQLKDDIALKVAILAEKYATDYNWYIDVCLKMLELAGDYVSEDIIYRFVQIIVGFENQEANTQLQVYACEKIIKLLEKDYVYENLVKLASIILGEFGHYLCNSDSNTNVSYNSKESNTGLDKQIEIILKHVPNCSNQTIYSVLTCFMKFFTRDNNLRSQVVPIFEQYLESWDPELQQRAIEYIILSKLDGEDPNLPNLSEIREKLFEKIPQYSKENFNNSILMKRLQQTQTGLYSENKDKIAITSESNRNNSPQNNISSRDSPTTKNNRILDIEQPDIQNFDKLIMSQEKSNSPYCDHILFEKNPSGFALHMNRKPDDAVPIPKQLISSNYDQFKSLLSNPVPFAGIIYSDQNFKIDCKVKILEGSWQLGIMLVFITTSSNAKLEDISLQLNNHNTKELLNIQISKPRYPEGNKGVDHPQILLKCNLIDSFSDPPSMSFYGRIGMMKLNVNFALPILISKFLENYVLPIETFSGLWFEISNSSKDSPYQKLDAILPNPMADNFTIMDFLKKLCSLLKNLEFKIYPPANRENFHEVEGVSILKCDNSVAIPILIQVSFIPSYPYEFRLSLRSKNPNNRFASLLLDIYSVIKFYFNY